MQNYVFTEKTTEAATRGVLWKNVFSEISQKSQENTCSQKFRKIHRKTLAPESPF